MPSATPFTAVVGALGGSGHASSRRCSAVAALMVGLVVLAGCASSGDRAVTPVGGAVAAVRAPSAPATSPHDEPGYRTDTTVPVVVAHGPTGGHLIALTFDSNMTDAMLHRLDTGQVASYANAAVVDELQARHVPATFFLAGKWVERYPVLDTPEVNSREHVQVALPLGDTEILDRVRERCDTGEVRAAGTTCLVEADLPGHSDVEPSDKTTAST